jgi:hypothetical protein
MNAPAFRSSELVQGLAPQPVDRAHEMRLELRLCPVLPFEFLERLTEDLRIMIGQGIGLEFLMPLAIDVLRRDPLASGDFYPGDLLSAVTKAEHEFWRRHEHWRQDVRTILKRVGDGMQVLGRFDAKTVARILREAPVFAALD